jgi:RNA polymerase sigma factor (sigma-70 family)
VADTTDDPTSPLLAHYLRKRADLVRFFSLRTSSPTEGEDIVQEIYLKLAHAKEEPENAAAYLYRLGTNVMLDRARARRRATTRDDAYYQVARVATYADDATDAPDPDAAIDARRRYTKVMAAVEALPPQCRRVFLMHKIDGLSYAEVAEKLDISRSAVEKHMIAALKRLVEHKE